MTSSATRRSSCVSPTDRPPIPKPGTLEIDRGPGAGTAQRWVGPTLDDTEERLIGPTVRLQGALAPPQGALHGSYDVRRRCGEGKADVEHHGDVGAEPFLDPNRHLRGEMDASLRRMETGTGHLSHRPSGCSEKT